MSFDWNTYVALAKTLHGMPDEAAWRSAVSRAYYSAFHAASSTLKNASIRTFPKDERKSHAKIWNVYKESTKKDCRRIGNRATRLMDSRHDADYDASCTFKQAEVARLISDTEALLVSIGTTANIPEGYTIGPPTSSSLLDEVLRFLGI